MKHKFTHHDEMEGGKSSHHRKKKSHDKMKKHKPKHEAFKMHTSVRMRGE